MKLGVAISIVSVPSLVPALASDCLLGSCRGALRSRPKPRPVGVPESGDKDGKVTFEGALLLLGMVIGDDNSFGVRKNSP